MRETLLILNVNVKITHQRNELSSVQLWMFFLFLNFKQMLRTHNGAGNILFTFTVS